jgi:hypothetical protein
VHIFSLNLCRQAGMLIKAVTIKQQKEKFAIFFCQET